MKKKDHTPWLLKMMRVVYPKLERFLPWVSQYVFRLVFYVPLRYKMPEKEIEASATSEKFSFQAAGKRIQGYSWGSSEAPYVMMVHGWAGRAMQFRKFVKPLQDAGFSVVAFDGPGHGQSEGAKTSILEFEEVMKVLVRLRGTPAAVITHSFGGGAILYAIMNGLPVSKVVNIASPTLADEILKTFLRAINGTWKSAERFKQYVVRRTGKPFEEFTGIYSIQRLPKPIDLLLVHDEDDKDVLIVHAQALMKVYPSARLYQTKGLGHTRILKDDGAIAATVEFIRSA